MAGLRELVLLALLGALVAVLPQYVQSICVGTGSLRSTNMGVEVAGDSIQFWPYRNNTRVLDFYNLTVRFTHVMEFLNHGDGNHLCSYDPDPDSNPPLQTFDLIEDFSCAVSTSTADLHPGAKVDTIVMNYTHDLRPSLSFILTLYVTDTYFEIRPSNDTTYVDPTEDYHWVFEYVSSIRNLLSQRASCPQKAGVAS